MSFCKSSLGGQTLTGAFAILWGFAACDRMTELYHKMQVYAN